MYKMTTPHLDPSITKLRVLDLVWHLDPVQYAKYGDATPQKQISDNWYRNILA